jgi:hypothetical protein
MQYFKEGYEMKKHKMILLVGAVLLLIGATTATALAAPGFSAQCALSGSYEDAAEFQAQMLERKQAILDERVADGTMTQDEADEIIAAIKENMANCGQDGGSRIGRGMGAGFGGGQGKGNRSGDGFGKQFNQQAL